MVKENLKSHNIDELRFNFKIKPSEKLVREMGNACSPDEEGDYVFLDSYKVEGVGHVASAVVSELEGGVRDFLFRFRYAVARGGRLKKSVPRVDSLLEILSVIEEPVQFNCLLRFLFGKRSKSKTFINLPIKFTRQSNAPFNEIHGVHLVKLEEKEINYEVILDLVDEGGFMETVIFGNRMKISESVVEKIIRKGIRISKSFVTEER